MADGLDVTIKLTGGKNLAKLSPGDKAYLKEALTLAAKVIRARARTGRSGDGRRLPAYSKKYLKHLEKTGRSTVPDLEYSGQLWRGLTAKVSSKLHGSVAFKGSRKTASGEKAQIKVRKKDGSTKMRNLTNQALASILAFRQTGKPLPPKPGNYVPEGRFMDLGKKDCERLVKLYDKYHTRHLAGLPPALP